MNNFRKVGTFDYQPIFNEVANTPLWNWLNLRKLAGHSDDIILRYQILHGRRPIRELMSDMRCVDYIVQEMFPKTMALIEQTFDRPIGRVVFAKLPPNTKIQPHIDEGTYSENTDRHHFVVTTNPDVIFHSGDEQFHMPRGEIYWFNNHVTHSVENMGTTNRIHLIVDTLK